MAKQLKDPGKQKTAAVIADELAGWIATQEEQLKGAKVAQAVLAGKG